jgi:L,D-peptidoglycan transpeptidase YkuD (ErfK/YbiS/YcfS/YnhG family)
MKRTTIRTIHVFAAPRDRRRGLIVAGGVVLACALGRSGTVHDKREGDGATPIGVFPLLSVLYRPDRSARPRTLLTPRRLRRSDGWCDAVGDRCYNRPVTRPYPASSEALWRPDHLYDLIVDIGHNRERRVQGRGSAIFMHVAHADLAPTEGCVALRATDLRRLLTCIGPHTRIRIR